MIINSARFTLSSPNHKKCPDDTRHEYAFIGRSNVGKSSLINMLAGNAKLAKYLKISPDNIVNARTYGGHGEQMAVFASTVKVDGKPLTQLIEEGVIPEKDWEDLKVRVIQGGKNIIDLRGRSSFQSPAYLSIEMIAAAMGGPAFRWPAGVYVNDKKFHNIMMAMETTISKDGVSFRSVEGTAKENAELEQSYKHLCALRDEVISLGIMPPIEKWGEYNPYLLEETK